MKIIKYLYQLKNTLIILVSQLRFNRGNLMECQKIKNIDISIENIVDSDTNFPRTFVDHHLLPDMDFNEHRLIKNNISIPKKVINLDAQLKILNTDFTLVN